MKHCLILLLVVPSMCTHLCAQNKTGTELRIKKAKGEIVLDGILDEQDWLEANVAKDWYLNYPVDTTLAPYQTEARITFNDQFLYVSFVCYDDDSPDLINSLRRDFIYDQNDNVGLNIGPYNDGINGFFFSITPKGVQREGIVSAGGAGIGAFNMFWDNKWYSKVARYKDKWIVEMAIPFKSFRYKSDLKEWNVLFDRADRKRNLRSSWIRVPIQYGTGSFAYSGKLIWEDPIPPAHSNISFIPFIAGGTSTDRETEPKTQTSDLQVGFDAKVGVTPSMNLDLTFNPDFSQVEVDEQVINLTRFEFQFPERRQFFLENSDLFDLAGFPESRIFFSRRIGIAADSNGILQRVPIAYGARLSGSLSKKWRLSVMSMRTKEKLSIGLPAQQYTVATLQRNFWRQSSFAVTYVDKHNSSVGPDDSLRYFHTSIFKRVTDNGQEFMKRNTYNRALAADLEMLSKDNRWYTSSYFARTFDVFHQEGNTSAGAFFQYAVRNVNVHVGHTYVGENFNAETGFVPSYRIYPGQFNYFSSFGYRFYPEGTKVVWMGPTAMFNQTYIPGGILTDKNYSLSYTFNLMNTGSLIFAYQYIFQRLTNDFNPIDARRYTPFLKDEEYSWQSITGTFQSDRRKIFNYLLQTSYGGFYNGTNLNINGQINVRYQPYGNIALRFDYNDLKFPEQYGKEKLFLIGPRIDLTFTDQIFLTTFIQYNNLMDNMNLNARFQWRYKPASDFFIVYTENYFPETFASKNRALVFKLTYWLNL